MAALSNITNTAPYDPWAALAAAPAKPSAVAGAGDGTSDGPASVRHDDAGAAGAPLHKSAWLCGQELHSYEQVWRGPIGFEFPQLLPRIEQELQAHPTRTAYVFGATEPQQFVLPRPPTLRGWTRLADGRFSGRVFGHGDFEDGEQITTGAVREQAEDTITTESGTRYRLDDLDLHADVAATPPPREEIRVLPIPVLTVVLSECPVPSLLGLTSVQSSTERIVPMRELKMSWCPWKGEHDAHNKSELHSRIYVLSCTQRNAATSHAYTSEERRKVFEYALPFIVRAKDLPDEPEPVTQVTATYVSERHGGKVVEFVFDKEMDRTQIFIPELIEDEGLDEDEFDDIKAALKAAFAAKRAANAAHLESRRALVAELSEVERTQLDDLRTLKVYPRSEQIDQDQGRIVTTFINRYYGHADETA